MSNVKISVKQVIKPFKSFFRPFLILFGFSKEEAKVVSPVEPQEQEIEGTDGLIDANGVIAREDNKMALVIDYEFGDVPVWVEWDIDLKQISIAQNGGAVAILNTVLSEKEARDFENTDKLLLCTNIGQERIVHTIPLLLRSSNDNEEDEMVDFGQELAV